MRERIVIVFIAIAIGLLVTTLIFFLYQQTKTIPQRAINTVAGPTKAPAANVYLSIDAPSDEQISDRRSIQMKGKTDPDNIIIVSTNIEDEVVKPTSDGRFSVTITIDAGANVIVIRAIAPNGEEAFDRRVVTFSTEEF
ncbi:MAG: hypothetical protein A3C30_01975 [Candidatus Levybacteria bacterium RIFCSPHIGHO2_02_FULL_40_18]|nr:MAG: hypothetical protein A2869_04355 [Candidatus Levybacteria bacterium RIFCSPHIGHO2_01_FULL_40_58]OGH26759.1 MAG: hypothetical protein A3C30_01975 [Candidatus Levybacteria bacterium RIFCSPHIGHO2_02_FULL_40_18]OGH31694.1 MAG: hypothetical protein A3E43_01695 [Candidatus Levybacteria bacterium RIFCSPHIGHO2_12_FULL_40_31]OGH40594.1 MAG: hypothetical protein A2894_00245 [Candidatus Levybacteria bacterium RIFCSPLOWO2_01_FULL_40_64]OGH48767.1 MAG: hypothetical protein A3I54_03870 [Candidatus Lev